MLILALSLMDTLSVMSYNGNSSKQYDFLIRPKYILGHRVINIKIFGSKQNTLFGHRVFNIKSLDLSKHFVTYLSTHTTTAVTVMLK